MNTLKTIGMIALLVVDLVIIVAVLLQSAKSYGLSGSITGNADTYFGQGKNKSSDVKLKKWTKIGAIVFLIASLVLSILINRL